MKLIFFCFLAIFLTSCNYGSSDQRFSDSCLVLSEKNLNSAILTRSINIQKVDSTDWSAHYYTTSINDESLLNFRFKRDKDLQDTNSDRIRVQFNLYDLDNVSNVTVKSTIQLGASFNEILEKDEEVGWLNIFEVWDSPAWKNKNESNKIHLSLLRSKGSDHFTPVLTSQTKLDKKSKWNKNWTEQLNLAIYPEKYYDFEIDVASTPKISVKITDDKDISQEIVLNKGYKDSSKLTIWGINPLKFYSGNKMLNRFLDKVDYLDIFFKNSEICLYKD